MPIIMARALERREVIAETRPDHAEMASESKTGLVSEGGDHAEGITKFLQKK
jgi:hypothetical protein